MLDIVSPYIELMSKDTLHKTFISNKYLLIICHLTAGFFF